MPAAAAAAAASSSSSNAPLVESESARVAVGGDGVVVGGRWGVVDGGGRVPADARAVGLRVQALRRDDGRLPCSSPGAPRAAAALRALRVQSSRAPCAQALTALPLPLSPAAQRSTSRDWVFSQHTLAEIAPVLQRSSFYVLISFRKVSEWWGHGLIKIQPVAKLTGFRTNGGEGMTAYIYINLEKVPQV